MAETHEHAVKRGKASKAQGAAFELKVRADLENKGFICDKWSNNVEFLLKEIKVEDFIAFTHKQINVDVSKPLEEEIVDGDIPTIIGVESKMTGELTKEEKEKCVWLLQNKIFSKILIASKTKVKNKIVIVYEDFKEKYWRFYER